jgi:hypothetical protein
MLSRVDAEPCKDLLAALKLEFPSISLKNKAILFKSRAGAHSRLSVERYSQSLTQIKDVP